MNVSRPPGHAARWLARAIAAIVLTVGGAGHADEPAPEPREPSADDLRRPQLRGPLFARYAYTASADAQGEEDPGASIGSHTAELSVIVPLYRSDAVALLLGSGYRYDGQRVDFAAPLPATPTVSTTFHLHRLPLSALLDLRFGPSWALLLHGGVVVASDLRSPDGDAVQPHAFALGTHAIDAQHSITFGAGVGYQFYELLPYPLLGYAFASTDRRLRFDVLLPAFAKATVSVGWGLDVALAGRFEGLVWQAEAERTSTRFLFKSQSAHVGLGVRRKLIGPLGIGVEGGANVWRRLDIGVDAESQKGVQLDPAPTFDVILDLIPEPDPPEEAQR